MAELKGSKTQDNLKEAFAGESQANRRYLYFAEKADIEGYPDVAALFRSVAEGETGHAFGHFDFLARGRRPGDRRARRPDYGQPQVGDRRARPTSTPRCTRASPRPRVTRASTRSPSGSRRSPGPRRATPAASPRASRRSADPCVGRVRGPRPRVIEAHEEAHEPATSRTCASTSATATTFRRRDHHDEEEATHRARRPDDDRVRERLDDAVPDPGDGTGRADAARRADRARDRDLQRADPRGRRADRARSSSRSPRRMRCASGCPGSPGSRTTSRSRWRESRARPRRSTSNGSPARTRSRPPSTTCGSRSPTLSEAFGTVPWPIVIDHSNYQARVELTRSSATSSSATSRRNPRAAAARRVVSGGARSHHPPGSRRPVARPGSSG